MKMSWLLLYVLILSLYCFFQTDLVSACINKGGVLEIRLFSQTSLAVQWLRIHLQCRGHGFNP